MNQCFRCGVLCSQTPAMLTLEGFICNQCSAEEDFIFPFSGFLELMKGLGFQTKSKTRKICSCGWEMRDFSTQGRLGCATCYTTFAEELAPILQKFHGATRHKGKVPKDRRGN